MTDSADPVMDSITQAVTTGNEGDSLTAREQLTAIWQEIGVQGDPFHRCTLAHYLADVCEHPAEALEWDIRALDAAIALTDQRAQAHHADLRVAGFFPSLHLNLADNHRRLGSFASAVEHIAHAKQHSSALSDDGYGDMIRAAIDSVSQAIEQQDTSRRPTAP